MEGLCTILYDTMRPVIIHINHLETLAEICSILRIEMIEEQVQQNRKYIEYTIQFNYTLHFWDATLQYLFPKTLYVYYEHL